VTSYLFSVQKQSFTAIGMVSVHLSDTYGGRPESDADFSVSLSLDSQKLGERFSIDRKADQNGRTRKAGQTLRLSPKLSVTETVRTNVSHGLIQIRSSPLPSLLKAPDRSPSEAHAGR